MKKDLLEGGYDEDGIQRKTLLESK